MGTAERLNSLVAELVPGLEPRTQWLKQALKQSIAPTFSPLSGTTIGFLVCVDSRAPEVRQYAAQIHTSRAATALAAVLDSAGDVEREIAECLREVVVRSKTEEPWQVVIGATVGARCNGARLYVGTLQPQESANIFRSLAETRMWFPPPRDETLELIDRVRATSALMGVSRRIGSTQGHQLYFAPNIPLTADLIAYVTAPLGKDSHRHLAEFTRRYACGVALSPRLFGWGLAIDRHGRFQSLKLEVSKYFESFANLPASSSFFEAALQVRSTGIHNDMPADPATVSCRVGGREPNHSIYFAFADPVAASREQSAPIPTRAIVTRQGQSTLANRVKSTVTRATMKLLAGQRSDGAWLDFNMPIGLADVWVTAHVGARLTRVQSVFPDNDVAEALRAACKFVAERWRDGWGYNSNSPVDADSTAHGMLFLAGIGCAAPDHAADALLRFQQPDGGFATFVHPEKGAPLHSWAISHADVTALAVRALQPYIGIVSVAAAVARAVEYMQTSGAAAGWPSFWWNLSWYTFATWLETSIGLGAHWPSSPDLSNPESGATEKIPLDCALRLHAAVLLRDVATADEVAGHLVECIGANDSWPVHAVLRLPEADVLHPWSFSQVGTVLPDSRAVYSAATICAALAGHYELTRIRD